MFDEWHEECVRSPQYPAPEPGQDLWLRRTCQIARCLNLGWLFSTWSLSKLRDMLARKERVDIGRETPRQILKTRGVSWHASKTGDAGNVPDFAAKMAHVLDRHNNPPTDGRVVCVDEFGPLNLQPLGSWFPRRHLNRLCATHNRTQGVRHTFDAVDPATGQLYFRIRDRNRWIEFLAFPEFPRARRPQEDPYLILDNDAAHKHLEVREWHRRRGRVGVRAYLSFPVNPDRVRVRRNRRPHPPERPARRADPQLRHRFKGPAPGLPDLYFSTM